MKTAIIVLSVLLYFSLLTLYAMWRNYMNFKKECISDKEEEIHDLKVSLLNKAEFNQHLRGELNQLQKIALSLASEKFGKDLTKATKILIIEGEEQTQTEIKLNKLNKLIKL